MLIYIKMGDLEYNQRAFYISIIIISILVILINLSLLISVLKIQKNNFTVKALSIQLLLSTIFYSLSFVLINFQKINVNIHCIIFSIEDSFSGSSMVLSSLCITLNSYFILTNNYTFHRKKQMMLVLLIVLTWIPSICILILFMIYRDDNELSCLIKNDAYWNWRFIFETTIEVITIVICLILLFKICLLKVQNDKELQISKKKTLKKIMSYIITIFIGIILKALGFKIFNKEPVHSSFIIVISVYILVLNYVFLWNKQLKESLLSIYCCKASEETEDTMAKNNQKELAFQYDMAEDQSNFDEEEPTDN